MPCLCCNTRLLPRVLCWPSRSRCLVSVVTHGCCHVCFALRPVGVCVAFQLRVSVAVLLELTELAKPVERLCLCCNTLPAAKEYTVTRREIIILICSAISSVSSSWCVPNHHPDLLCHQLCVIIMVCTRSSRAHRPTCEQDSNTASRAGHRTPASACRDLDTLADSRGKPHTQAVVVVAAPLPAGTSRDHTQAVVVVTAPLPAGTSRDHTQVVVVVTAPLPAETWTRWRRARG